MQQSILGAPPHWQDRFVAVPAALHDLVVSPREYQLVALLLGYRWSADSLIYPSVRTLAARLGCSERTVQRTCAALEARGLLVREARYRDDSGQQSNCYHLAGALLALVSVSVDARREPACRPPVTRPSVERTRQNYQQAKRGRQSVIPTAGSAYLETRRGVLSRR